MKVESVKSNDLWEVSPVFLSNLRPGEPTKKVSAAFVNIRPKALYVDGSLLFQVIHVHVWIHMDSWIQSTRRHTALLFTVLRSENLVGRPQQVLQLALSQMTWTL